MRRPETQAGQSKARRGRNASGYASAVRGPPLSTVLVVPRVRLDSLLAERGLFDSRTRAAAAVIAGEVHLGPGRRRAEKPGQLVDPEVAVEVQGPPPYVSRGGIKLANPLDALALPVAGRRAVGVGAPPRGLTRPPPPPRPPH